MRVKFLAAAAALVLLAACDSGTSGSGGITGSGSAPVLANPPGSGVGQGGVNSGALGAGGVRAGSQEDLNQ
ncbi:MAG: hypothetical protein JNJ97_01900, partial [Alphaproteobacteria bacterium]|nr:hypothetical protein [Alphaproteobacteria bacterium]